MTQKINSEELKTYSKGEVQRALEKSIKKWKRNLKNAMNKRYSEITLSGYKCALCNLFFMNKEGYYIYSFAAHEYDCIGCPIQKKTGLTKCYKTPYETVSDIFYSRNYGEYKDKALFQKDLIDAIEKEIAFLESLRETNGDENG